VTQSGAIYRPQIIHDLVGRAITAFPHSIRVCRSFLINARQGPSAGSNDVTAQKQTAFRNGHDSFLTFQTVRVLSARTIRRKKDEASSSIAPPFGRNTWESGLLSLLLNTY